MPGKRSLLKRINQTRWEDQKKMKVITNHKLFGQVFAVLASLGMAIFAPSVYAAPVFFDDFEDGNHDGWLVTITGNSLGSTGVELHNGSMMAVVRDTGSTSFSLSRDFSYTPTDTLSFTMQAIANSFTCRAGSGCSVLHAESGVEVSFLSSLNSTLGSVSISNATDLSWLSGADIAVDTAQHDYLATMSEFAALAGLGSSDLIAKMQLSFFAKGQTFGNVSGVAHSSSVVWFDDVSVSTIPIPAAAWLFGSGLLGLIGIARRKKA